MIEIEEALAKVAAECEALPPAQSPLADVTGHVLAEPVISDVNSPPFDKSMMDGFALRCEDFAGIGTKLKIVGRVLAGSSHDRSLQAGEAVQIMTGAPVPEGADAVVMVEQTEENESVVSLQCDQVRSQQNIIKLGTAMKDGQPVFPVGHRVRPEDIGVLAEAGGANCRVIPRPTLAIIATGDELVRPETKPSINQIRNSNGPMLFSLARPLCRDVQDLGIGPDQPQQLGDLIGQGLQDDVLVLSGGVSAGVADLVPGLLKDAGVQQVFHKVRIKPGKPIWFGVLKKSDGKQTLVFGLPGNPVSSMVCFRIFVAPALLAMAGRKTSELDRTATLATEHNHRPGRTTYWPCRLDEVAQRSTITPLNWKGSSDLRTLAEANCFGIFDGDREVFQEGEIIQLLVMG